MKQYYLYILEPPNGNCPIQLGTLKVLMPCEIRNTIANNKALLKKPINSIDIFGRVFFFGGGGVGVGAGAEL